MKLDDLKTAVIALGLIALIAAAVAIALNEFRDDQNDDLDVGRVTNETVTWVNNTYTPFVHHDTLKSCNADSMFNASGHDGLPYGSGNYTCARGQGILINDDDIEGIATSVVISYTYGVKDAAFNATDQGLEGTTNLTDYLDTIGTIMAIAVLIGLVIGAFAFGRRR